MCSLEAKGLLIDLMSLAHLGDPYGTVTNGGMALLEPELSQVLNIHPRTLRKSLEVLMKHKRVIQDSEGRLAIPRMIKDAEELEKFRVWGKSGGNPLLVHDKPADKGGDNPPDKAEQRRGEQRKKPPTPLQGDADSLDGYPLEREIYIKHPALKELHSEPNLRGVTLEVYLTLIRRRSEFMNPLAAAKEAASSAALLSGIRSQGPYVDKCFSRFEQDHAADISRAQQLCEERRSIRKDFITFYCENWKKSPDMIDRARADFGGKYGKKFIQKCEEEAERIVAQQAEPPDWLDPSLVDFGGSPT
jgi:hypothetical protein